MTWRKWQHQRHLGWIVGSIGLAIFLITFFLMSAIEGSHKHFDQMVGWAGIFALPVAIVGILIQFLSWLRPIGGGTTPMALDEQAQLLAEAVLRTESHNLRRLIRGDYAAQVQFSADSARTLKDDGILIRLRELLRFSNESGNDAGDLSNIAKYFQSLTLPRMAVLGPPGAGKTILLISLVVQSLRGTERRKAVAIRMDLAGYDPFSLDLTSWLASRIATQYPISEPVARRLVESGRVLPVLDGLDEMDNNQAAPVRATATLGRINSYVTGMEFGAVLACREMEWERITSRTDSFSGFSVIHIQPLNLSQVRNYITARLNEVSQDASAWRKVLKQIEQDPTNPIVGVLSRPLWLGLAVIVFRLNPQDLLQYTDSADLQARLLAGFVSATVHLFPRRRSPDKPRYHEKDVVNWLRELARFLDGLQPGDHENIEIVPDRLWPIAGSRRVRLLHTLLASVMGALTLITLWSGLRIFMQSASPSLNGRVQGLIATAAIAGTLVAVGIIRSSSDISAPPRSIARMRFHRIRIRKPSSKDLLGWLRQVLRKSFIDGYQVKFLAAFLIILPVGVYLLPGKHALGTILALALAIISFYVLFGMFTLTLEVISTPIRAMVNPAPLEPRRPYDALNRDSFVAASIVVSAVALVALTDIISPPTSSGKSYFGGLGALIFLFIVLVSRASVRYILAVIVTASSRMLPVRLKPFLNWSVDAGLLREAGPAYQFRHVELQRWLTDRPHLD